MDDILDLIGIPFTGVCGADHGGMDRITWMVYEICPNCGDITTHVFDQRPDCEDLAIAGILDCWVCTLFKALRRAGTLRRDMNPNVFGVHEHYADVIRGPWKGGAR